MQQKLNLNTHHRWLKSPRPSRPTTAVHHHPRARTTHNGASCFFWETANSSPRTRSVFSFSWASCALTGDCGRCHLQEYSEIMRHLLMYLDFGYNKDQLTLCAHFVTLVNPVSRPGNALHFRVNLKACKCLFRRQRHFLSLK